MGIVIISVADKGKKLMEHTLNITESALEAVNNDLPTLYEELNRKTLDTALDLVTHYESGEISPAQFYTGFNVLFSAVSGLASNECVQFAFQGASMVEKNKGASFFKRRMFFKNGGPPVIIESDYGHTHGRIRIYDRDCETMKQTDLPSASALDVAVEKLVKLNYKEVD